MTWPTSLSGYGANAYSAQNNCGLSTGYTGSSAYKNFSPNALQTTYIPPTNYRSQTAPYSACCSPSDGTGVPPSYMPRVVLLAQQPGEEPDQRSPPGVRQAPEPLGLHGELRHP